MKTDIKEIAYWLVLIGALVHLILGLGMGGILAALNGILPFVQIAVGVSGLYLIAKKLKLIK